jgi:hypothetical protein
MVCAAELYATELEVINVLLVLYTYTLYVLGVSPPVVADAVTTTLRLRVPPVGVPTVGAPGTVTGVVVTWSVVTNVVSPALLYDMTFTLYVVPLVRPVIV